MRNRFNAVQKRKGRHNQEIEALLSKKGGGIVALYQTGEWQLSRIYCCIRSVLGKMDYKFHDAAKPSSTNK